MDQKKYYIGFDLGAESGRCVVGTLQKGTLSLTEVHRFPTPWLFYQGHYYWDVLQIVAEIEAGLRAAGETFGPRFEGISVDTWGVDYVLLDTDNRILGYPYHYRDSRTDGMIERAFERVPREELYLQTGTQVAPFNTLYQLLAEQNQHVNLLEVADRLLLMPDFLLFVLSGKKIGEYTIVSTTGLANPNRRNWNWKLIEAFGLPRQIFPNVVESGTVIGHLQEELAKKTGLNPETPVIASASHDTGAAVAAVPAESEGWAFLSSGTWSLMGVEIRRPILNAEAMTYNFTNEGGVNGTIRFLKNIMGLWPIQECRRAWRQEGKEFSYEDLKQLALKNGPTEAWIDVDDPRFLKAGDMPQKILNFLKETKQPYHEDAGWITRCVLESLAFKYRTTIQDIEYVTGQSVTQLLAVGGGIQNNLLNQLAADAIHRNIVTGPVEGTIVGNIGVQAIARGAVASLSDWRAIVRRSFQLETYRPQHPDYFQTNEEKFRAVLQQS
ncbi:MAG: rhamnulokinase [Calditrichaeota bacterium]|nr:rhamnulokinase [Calditrichota bacterium]